MKFNITNYKYLKESKEQKAQAIKAIEQEHIVAMSVAQSKITQELLKITGEKLDTLISQRNNKQIIKLEENYVAKKKEITKEIKGLKSEQEDILALMTSVLGQKKRVINITLTDIKDVDKGEVYIAYLSNEVQAKITMDDHVEIAKRYLEVSKKIEEKAKASSESEKTFIEAVKEIDKDYVVFNFEEEIYALNQFSKRTFYSVDDLTESEFVQFYGSEDDFKEYKKDLKNIEEKLESYKKLLQKESK